MANFIEVPTAMIGNVSINIDNISSVKSFMGGSTIVLKEIKDGKSVEITSTSSYQKVMQAIDYFNSK